MNMENETYQNELSVVLSDILKCGGYFNERINVIRSKCLLFEKITKDLSGSTLIQCGSSMAEGSLIHYNDNDLMFVLPETIAINEDYNLIEEKKQIFSMSFKHCLPGYTRLRVHKLDSESSVYTVFQTMIEEDRNIPFLSSENFREIFKDKRNELWPLPYSRNFYFHGPCSTVLWENEIWDQTTGIECHSWPVATEWLHRPRVMGWPSQALIDKISLFPVHVLPVGDLNSVISSTQWRFSFVFAERELIWNFNDIQLQCYVLLKIIFKCKLEFFFPDELWGYQLKHLLFWISEEYGAKIFTKDNLIRCLEICFVRFKDQILYDSLLHYIHRDRNLLAGRLDCNSKTRIVNEIMKIMDNMLHAIVECRHCIPTASKYLDIFEGSNRLSLCDEWTLMVLELKELQKSIQWECFLNTSYLCLCIAYFSNDINKKAILIEDIFWGNNIPDDIQPYMRVKLVQFISMQLAVCFYECTFINEGQNRIDFWLNHANPAFEVGTSLDELSGNFYLATFQLLNNETEMASSNLSRVMQNTKPFVYSGCCSSIHFRQVLQYKNTEIHHISYESVNVEDLSNCLDMIFHQNFVHFALMPIKYELILQQCTNNDNVICRYHPVVYSFYLMFEIARKTGGQIIEQNEILRKLSSFIESCAGGLELHRAYNILGFCYNVCGRIDDAVAVYGESIKIQSDNTNAAVYHLCILLLNYIKSDCKQTIIYQRTK